MFIDTLRDKLLETTIAINYCNTKKEAIFLIQKKKFIHLHKATYFLRLAIVHRIRLKTGCFSYLKYYCNSLIQISV